MPLDGFTEAVEPQVIELRSDVRCLSAVCVSNLFEDSASVRITGTESNHHGDTRFDEIFLLVEIGLGKLGSNLRRGCEKDVVEGLKKITGR